MTPNTKLAIPLALVTLALAPSCLGPSTSRVVDSSARPGAKSDDPSIQVLPKRAEPVLYARDGSVVSSRPSGTVTPTGEPVRDVTDGGGSRMYLLELYQGVVEERDAYQREVEVLHATITRLEAELASERAARAGLAAEYEKLQQGFDSGEERQLELAARLATAQIGRLQAEKALLEAKLQWDAVRRTVAPADAGPGTGRPDEGLGMGGGE